MKTELTWKKDGKNEFAHLTLTADNPGEAAALSHLRWQAPKDGSRWKTENPVGNGHMIDQLEIVLPLTSFSA